MWKSTVCRWWCVLLLLPCLAHGAEVKGLYEAEVQVFSQKRAERATAMGSALAEVLSKVSGQRDAALAHGVATAIRRPAAFLQQYRYRALPDADKLVVAPGEEPQMVVFRFDKQAVDKLLRDNGLPVWGATRPATLVWLAVEDDGQRYLVGSDSPETIRNALERESRRRGMALVLPLLDLEDQIKLRFADVWGGFRDPVLSASARYHTEAVLMGRMQHTAGGEWRGSWTLLEGHTVQSWDTGGVLAEEVVDAGVAGVVEQLAARYAPASGTQQAGPLALTVTAVHNLADYARVSHYLQSLQQVTSLQATRVDADQVSFALGLRGDADSLAQTIALGNVLVAAKPQAPPAAGVSTAQDTATTAMYQLLP
jgi:hypothetical protein